MIKKQLIEKNREFKHQIDDLFIDLFNSMPDTFKNFTNKRKVVVRELFLVIKKNIDEAYVLHYDEESVLEYEESRQDVSMKDRSKEAVMEKFLELRQKDLINRNALPSYRLVYELLSITDLAEDPVEMDVLEETGY